MSKLSVPERIENWFLDQNLGSGFSGSIWRVTNVYTGQVAAMKIQHVDTDCPTNRYERSFYPLLQGGVGMPTLYTVGIKPPYDYLVIDLLGQSLDSIYRQNDKRVMDLRSVVCIAMQVISRLEFMHSRGLLHRDIQLGNCVLGLPPNERIIYMIDFGFSKRYLDSFTGRHIPDSRAKRDFIGNYWFSSVNVHCRGRVPTRRDDLEALALMLIHLLIPGGLPWTRHGVPRDDYNLRRVEREKLHARPEELCEGLPDVFEEFLRYCRRLKFAETPDYQRWREEFAELARDRGWADSSGNVDDAFIWPPREEVIVRSKPPRAYKKPGQQNGVSDLLADLANLDLNKHQIDSVKKTRKANGSSKDSLKENARDLPVDPTQKKQTNSAPQVEVIYVSGGTSDSTSPKPLRPTVRHVKAAKLNGLTEALAKAGTTAALAYLLAQFADVFVWNKVMTREGFDFLEAFRVRLGSIKDGNGGTGVTKTQEGVNNEPSVQVPTSRRVSARRRVASNQPSSPVFLDQQELVRHFQLTQIQLPSPLPNKTLSEMVKHFEDILRNATSRSVNKHGAVFLRILIVALDPTRKQDRGSSTQTT